MSDIPMIENYNPKYIVLGKVEEKAVKFFLSSKNDNNYSKIRFQTPKMKIPFDIDNKKTSTGKIFVKNISLSTNEIGSENNKKRIEILRSKIEKTEKYIKKLLPTHLQNKKFCNSLWQGRNTDFKPILKVSIGFDRDDNVKAGIFDNDNNPLDVSKVSKGQTVSLVLRFDKLWVWNDKIGINWEVEQLKIYDKEIEPSRGSKKKRMVIRTDE